MRVFRVVKPPPFDLDDPEEYYGSVRRSLERSYAAVEVALRMRVPRSVGTFVVRNSRGKAVAVATVMQYVPGPTLSEELEERGSLPSGKLRDLATLFRILWTKRLSHGDVTGGNVVYDQTHRRYVLVDLDNVRQHPTPAAAKAADMPMIRAGLPAFVAAHLFRAAVLPTRRSS